MASKKDNNKDNQQEHEPVEAKPSEEPFSFENPLGVDLATESFKIKTQLFKLNPDGALPEVCDKIEEYVDEYEEYMKNPHSEKEARTFARGQNKKILELGLEKFNYDTAAKIFGHGVLDKSAKNLYRFFLNGGVDGLKHLLHQLGLDTLNTSNGTEEVPSSDQ